MLIECLLHFRNLKFAIETLQMEFDTHDIFFSLPPLMPAFMSLAIFLWAVVILSFSLAPRNLFVVESQSGTVTDIQSRSFKLINLPSL
jgi:hypothetical protein